MSAFAMAILLKGMSLEETVFLTRSMLNSGEVLRWTPGSPVVDKHSTGGIGDKVSIPLAPMLACCGVRVPMISGRGLGPTGGTLDKLESIAGFRTDLSKDEIYTQVNSLGCVITGASPELAPADRKLYALRDVTGTVESIPLITASILSKKLAAGLDALVMDVKFGSGAFMKTVEQANELAKSLVAVGQEMGVKTTALLTNMNQTLGRAAGNENEIRESIEILAGNGPRDVTELTVELGAWLLRSVSADSSLEACRNQLVATISSSTALQCFKEMVAMQGGDDSLSFSQSPAQDIQETPVVAKRAGYVSAIDAQQLGFAIIEMGGGRKRLADLLDHRTGITQIARLGDFVHQGDELVRFFNKSSHENERLEVQKKIEDAIVILDSPPKPFSLIHSIIE